MNKTKHIVAALFFVCLVLMISGCESGHTAKVQEDNMECAETSTESSEAKGEHAETAIPETAIPETTILETASELSDIPEVFLEVLRQYLQIPVGTNLYSDAYWEKVTQGDWKDVYEYLGGAENICYSLSDLTNDGFPELIMGSYADADAVLSEDEKVFQVQGSGWENSYVWIYVVYYYNGNEVKQVCQCEGNRIELYENGIIHYSGGGVSQPMQYLQFQTDTEDYETGAYIELKIENGEVIGYLKAVGDDYVEITEDEYHQIVEQYTTSPVELEWTVLK